jgi:hypothetical protein
VQVGEAEPGPGDVALNPEVGMALPGNLLPAATSLADLLAAASENPELAEIVAMEVAKIGTSPELVKYLIPSIEAKAKDAGLVITTPVSSALWRLQNQQKQVVELMNQYQRMVEGGLQVGTGVVPPGTQTPPQFPVPEQVVDKGRPWKPTVGVDVSTGPLNVPDIPSVPGSPGATPKVARCARIIKEFVDAHGWVDSPTIPVECESEYRTLRDAQASPTQETGVKPSSRLRNRRRR